jgi:hypothetical protein
MCPQKQKPSNKVDLGVWKLVIIQVGIVNHEEGKQIYLSNHQKDSMAWFCIRSGTLA